MLSSLSDTILANLLDGVLIINHEGIIVYANQASFNLFSKRKENLVGQQFGFPITPQDVQEIEIFTSEGVRTVQMLATEMAWKDAPVYLLSMRDITELKRTTIQLQAEKKVLERVNQDLEQYASIASHDLKEPIRKILFYTDYLLQEENGFNDKSRKWLLNVSNAANRMNTLLSSIAEYSKHFGELVQPQTVDLNVVVDEVLQDMEITIAEKNASVMVAELPSIEASPIQMHQLFLNIISNAIKYSKPDVDPAITISITDLDSLVEIIIADNGIGFDERHASKIFLPFERLQFLDAEGTGIGLAICKKIVDVHGGDIGVASSVGKGSTFFITLPRRQQIPFEQLS